MKERARAGRIRRGSVDSGARHTSHLRGLNLERVLAVSMERPGLFTRLDLIEATALSAPTVGSLVSELIRDDLLIHLGTGPSRGGRRPSFMEFNARHGFVAGIDLGPSTIRLAVADLRGERLAGRVMPTPPGLGPREMLTRIAKAMKALLREARVPPKRLLAVCAGVPGVVDREKGTVVALVPNLKNWSHVEAGRQLERVIGAPVVVENDVNLAILGERWRGAARGHDTCAFITVGTGVGAGIVLDGELHRGHHSLAGEIALMCMGPQFLDRDFGTRGCLESLAGLGALAEGWPRTPRRNGDTWVGELFAAARAGDRRARKLVDDAVLLIGIATANLMLVLDPSLIVLGGTLAARGEHLVEEVRAVAMRIVPTPSNIVGSALGDEAVLWGSLLVARTEARERLRRRLREGSA
jgi:glucokinase